MNKDWLERTQIPDTETRTTQAYFIGRRVNRELDTIIARESAKPTGLISDMVSSWSAAEKTPIPSGLSPLLHLATTAQCPTDFSALLGWMNSHGMPAPLQFYITGDPRNNERCRMFIGEGWPQIGIPEYWSQPEYAGHRTEYGKYVRRLARVLGLPVIEKGYYAEREFTHIFPPAVERRVRINMLNWNELNAQFTTIDWTRMFREYGMEEADMKKLMFNVSSASFIHSIQSRMRSWSADRWQGWFALIIAQWAAGITPHGPLRDAWFAYKRRFLQGMKSDDTPHELRMAVVRMMLPNTLGKLWTSEFCQPSLKRDVQKLVKNVLEAAIAAVQKTSWMSPTTRAAAAKKLRRMDIEVGWPDSWPRVDLSLPLSRTDYIQNMLFLAAESVNMNIAQLRKGCRSPTGTGWSRPVYEVNAFYYPNENRFLLPAAILRYPFYDPARSLAWNYGAIGSTIGHELCHAFDADGREYDEKGDKRDWWTKHDAAEYKQRANAVVNLYESRQYRGLEVDGYLTLVENIADLGGMEFSLAGFRAAVGRPLKKEELREFFEAYAISWRSKDRLKRAAELLATDSHSPPMLRVNHAVRQMDEWYEAFDVKEGCEGYIPPAKRIHFFS